MKIFRIIPLFLLLMMAGCLKPKDDIMGPYTQSYIPDKTLYNQIYNDIYEQLTYFMGWKLGMTTADEIALLLEMDDTSYIRASELYNSDVMNGWMVIEDSSIMLSPTQIQSLTAMKPNAELLGLPTAKYYISFEGNKATVNIYFWLVQKFAYTYTFSYEKNMGRWELTDRLLISGSDE